MYCPKCGANNPDRAKACSVCGAQLAGLQGDVKQVAMPDGNRLRFANPGMHPSEISGGSGGSVYVSTPKKSRKKAMIIALSCISACIVLCVALVLVFLPQLERAILGETVYYLFREAETVDTVVSSEYVQACIPNKTFSATTELTATCSTKAEDDLDAQITETVLKKSKILAQIDYDARQKKADIDLSVAMDSKNLASARIEMADGAVGFSLPTLADGQLVYRSDTTEQPTIRDITGYSKTELAGMLKDIGKSVEEGAGIADKTVTGHETFNGQNCRYTEITLDSESLRDATVCVLDAFLKNPDAVLALKNAIAYENGYYRQLENSLADIADLIDLDDFELDADDCIDALEETRDELEDMDIDNDTEYVIKIYYSSRGDVLSRNITVTGDNNRKESLVLDTVIDGKKTDIAYKYTAEWKSEEVKYTDVYSFTLTAEKSNGKLSGTAKLTNKWNGSSETYFTVDFSDISVEKCGGLSLLSGQVNGEIGDGEMKISLISTVSDSQSTVTGKVTTDVGEMYETTYSATATSTVSKSADVSDVVVANKSTLDLDEETVEDIVTEFEENVEDLIGDDIQKIYDDYYARNYYDYGYYY